MSSNAVYSIGSFVNIGRSRANTHAFESNCRASAVGPQEALILNQRRGSTLGAYNSHGVSKCLVDKIREGLLKMELSVSAYDTAWVAMVPSLSFPKTPYFPKCIDWIIDNQLPDGSWVPTHMQPSIIKDALSSTLACVLALRRWNVGEEHAKRGLSFIGSNFSSSINGQLPSPVGFNIIFPGMISYAVEMELDLPLRECDIDAMFIKREEELERELESNSAGSKAYLAFVAEGLCGMQNWQEVMSYQRKNGSLFNSPSTTAAALGHVRDSKLLNYLKLILQRFGCSVPTIYPLDMHTHLSVVDTLERLGLSQHFIHDIKRILDTTYRYWVDNDEEIFSDIATNAMAFRILRMHGYDISSDALSPFASSRQFMTTIQGHIKHLNTVLELYKASQTQIAPKEPVLKNLKSWVTDLLKEELSRKAIDTLDILEEVDYTLKFPFYSNLERLEHKRNIEHYKLNKLQMLKTSFMPHMNDSDLLELAVDTFSSSQVIYRKELQYIERWVKESHLDQLEFSRQKYLYCYLSTAATLFYSELTLARLFWAQSSVLTTVVDDFFDGGGSSEELANLIILVEKWHGVQETDFCSKNVKIIFLALYNTINELGAKAFCFQNRDITNHVINTWLATMNSMMKEAHWLKNSIVPTVDEYMTTAIPSAAVGPIIVSSLYFIEPELSENVVESPEYYNLLQLVGKLCRLLNDIQGFERDKGQGKLNSLSLFVLHGNRAISEEEAGRHVKSLIESARTELLGLVLQNKGSVVPTPCKELFWKMSKILHLFYRHNDGFSSPKEMVNAVNAVIHEPLKI